MFCPQCGGRRADNDKFCVSCGAALPPPAEAAGPPPVESGRASLIASEHSGLREEIVKRIELQVQLISITLAAAAALLTVGLPREGEASVASLLIYPVLALFTWATWSFHQLRINELAAYIRELEKNPAYGLGWETFSRETRSKHFLSRHLPLLTFGGLWVTSQAMLLTLGLVTAYKRGGLQPEESILFVIDIAAIILTLSILAVFSNRGFMRTAFGLK